MHYGIEEKVSRACTLAVFLLEKVCIARGLRHASLPY